MAEEKLNSYHMMLDSYSYPIAQVFKQRFWMMLHGAATPKPTVCWSNDEHVLHGLVPRSNGVCVCVCTRFASIFGLLVYFETVSTKE